MIKKSAFIVPAVEQIDSAGGINGKMLELVIYDDQAKPAQAIPIANKLIGQDKVVVGVSGSYSGPTRSAAGVTVPISALAHFEL